MIIILEKEKVTREIRERLLKINKGQNFIVTNQGAHS
jgi:hypothetical protein